MQETIYNFIVNHLDEQGRFTETELCDDANDTIPRPLGAEDAFSYSKNMEADAEVAFRLSELLKQYMSEPSQNNRSELYKELQGEVFASYCDPFIETFTADDMNVVAFDLARRFFYNSQQREQVKFALLLFGLYGMERICEEDNELWQDLVKVAHCEEFTFPFLFSCRISKFTPQSAVWELLRCTHGWGRVFAISDCKCASDEERLWLLEHGTDISVEYPPLSIKFIQETQLEEQLEGELTYAQYKSAVVIVGNYLLLLRHMPIASIEESFNITSIDLHKLLTLILQQADKHIQNPEDILDMISYAETLRGLADAHNFSQLTMNQSQLLIAAYEKIVYSKDFSEKIISQLFTGDQVNYTFCDLAVELELDIWPQLFDFWKHHLLETNLLSYLLSYEGDGRPQQVLKVIARHLPEFSIETGSLLVPLRYLSMHPGEGEAVICAALTSIYDLTRGIACGALEEWPQEFISPAIRDALMEGRKLSNNDLVTARIDSLLQGKKFSLEKFLEL